MAEADFFEHGGEVGFGPYFAFGYEGQGGDLKGGVVPYFASATKGGAVGEGGRRFCRPSGTQFKCRLLTGGLRRPAKLGLPLWGKVVVSTRAMAWFQLASEKRDPFETRLMRNKRASPPPEGGTTYPWQARGRLDGVLVAVRRVGRPPMGAKADMDGAERSQKAAIPL